MGKTPCFCFCASIVGGVVQSLAGELRSSMPCDVAKKNTWYYQPFNFNHSSECDSNISLVLICISMKNEDDENLHMLIFHLCIFFGAMSIQIFCPFYLSECLSFIEFYKSICMLF